MEELKVPLTSKERRAIALSTMEKITQLKRFAVVKRITREVVGSLVRIENIFFQLDSAEWLPPDYAHMALNLTPEQVSAVFEKIRAHYGFDVFRVEPAVYRGSPGPGLFIGLIAEHLEKMETLWNCSQITLDEDYDVE